MSKGLKIMLFWSLVFPTIITILRIITDYILEKEFEWFSYIAVFLGIGAGGLLFAGPLMYLISKSKEEDGGQNAKLHYAGYFNPIRRLQRFDNYKAMNKVDKGFAINYFKLSYRRKMIRTIFSFPIVILTLLVIYLFFNWSMKVNILIGFALTLIFIIQLIYNFNMWKKNER